MWSPASAIFASIVTILVSFEVILMYFKPCGSSLLKIVISAFRIWQFLKSEAHKEGNSEKGRFAFEGFYEFQTFKIVPILILSNFKE